MILRGLHDKFVGFILDRIQFHHKNGFLDINQNSLRGYQMWIH